MTICRGTKADGTACSLPANGPHGWCWAHNPEHREKRKKMASKAAKSKPNREIADIKAQLKDVIDGVLEGSIERNVGSVAFQGYRTLLQAVSTELAVREQMELVERLDGIEEALQAKRRGWYDGGA
jgi:hypothetical protein